MSAKDSCPEVKIPKLVSIYLFKWFFSWAWSYTARSSWHTGGHRLSCSGLISSAGLCFCAWACVGPCTAHSGFIRRVWLILRLWPPRAWVCTVCRLARPACKCGRCVCVFICACVRCIRRACLRPGSKMLAPFLAFILLPQAWLWMRARTSKWSGWIRWWVEWISPLQNMCWGGFLTCIWPWRRIPLPGPASSRSHTLRTALWCMASARKALQSMAQMTSFWVGRSSSWSNRFPYNSMRSTRHKCSPSEQLSEPSSFTFILIDALLVGIMRSSILIAMAFSGLAIAVFAAFAARSHLPACRLPAFHRERLPCVWLAYPIRRAIDVSALLRFWLVSWCLWNTKDWCFRSAGTGTRCVQSVGTRLGCRLVCGSRGFSWGFFLLLGTVHLHFWACSFFHLFNRWPGVAIDFVAASGASMSEFHFEGHDYKAHGYFNFTAWMIGCCQRRWFSKEMIGSFRKGGVTGFVRWMSSWVG